MAKNYSEKYTNNRANKNNIYIHCDPLNSKSNSVKNNNVNSINLNYFINKFLVYSKEESKFLYCNKIKVVGNNKSDESKIGKEFICEYNDYIKNYCKLYNFDLICDENTRELLNFTAHKLIIGFGNPSVLEKSITIHHIYGIPYIPGQTIKGCMRSYFLSKYYDIELKKFKEQFLKGIYKLIFGEDVEDDDNCKGGVIFFDIFPKLDENFGLKQDVMTPHYNDYYTKNNKAHNLPKDDKDPIPNIYYILDNKEFDFPMALDKKRYADYEEKCKKNSLDYMSYDELKNFLIELLKNTLLKHGIGAKTAVGYGRFEYNSEEVTDKMLEALRNKINSER